MAAEAQRAPSGSREQNDFARAWVIAWRRIGGFIFSDAAGRRCVSYQLNRVDAETRGALRALMTLLDSMSPSVRDNVFKVAMECGR